MSVPTTTERLRPLMDAAFEAKLLPSDLVTAWEFGTTLLPTPQGMRILAMFTITAKNPVMGSPEIMHGELRAMDELVLDQDSVNGVVDNLLNTVRSSRAHLLSA